MDYGPTVDSIRYCHLPLDGNTHCWFDCSLVRWKGSQKAALLNGTADPLGAICQYGGGSLIGKAYEA